MTGAVKNDPIFWCTHCKERLSEHAGDQKKCLFAATTFEAMGADEYDQFMADYMSQLTGVPYKYLVEAPPNAPATFTPLLPDTTELTVLPIPEKSDDDH